MASDWRAPTRTWQRVPVHPAETASAADTPPADARVRLARLWRFGAVSVMNVVVTQVLLLGAYKLTSLGGVGANVFAVGVSSIPAYLVNRRWVWGRRGKHSVTREVLPFWGYTFAGLALSTGAVAFVDHRWDSAMAVSAANITAFAVLWSAKFFLLDQLFFVDNDNDNDNDSTTTDNRQHDSRQ